MHFKIAALCALLLLFPAIAPASADYYDEIDKCSAIAEFDARLPCIKTAFDMRDPANDWSYVEVQDSMTDDIAYTTTHRDAAGSSTITVLCQKEHTQAVIMLQIDGFYDRGPREEVAMVRFDSDPSMKTKANISRGQVYFGLASPIDPNMVSGMLKASRLRIRVNSDQGAANVDFKIKNFDRVQSVIAKHCTF